MATAKAAVLALIADMEKDIITSFVGNEIMIELLIKMRYQPNFKKDFPVRLMYNPGSQD